MNNLKQTDFFSRESFKNGADNIHFIEREVYRILYSSGFRFVRIDRKPFMYKLDKGEKIRLVRHFQELRGAFVDHVKQLPIPAKEIDEILNAFYKKRPIKRNGLIEHYLTDTTEPGFWIISEIKRQTEDLN
jgi:hypothetical protein